MQTGKTTENGQLNRQSDNQMDRQAERCGWEQTGNTCWKEYKKRMFSKKDFSLEFHC